MKAELVLGNLKRERDALDNKLERLEAALNKEWQDEDQEYLCTQQYNAMSLYAHILDERIADIEYKLEKKKTANKNSIPHEENHTSQSIFNKEVDLGCCKNMNNICNHDDSEDIVADLLKDIFGIKIVYEE